MVINVKKIYFIFVILSIIACLFIYKNKNGKKINNLLENSEIMPVSKTDFSEYNPLVYIYNTHQKETYSDDALNLNPSVLDAAHTLRDYLEELDIQTYVEDSDFYELLALNNWDYNNLYKVSRFYLEDAMKRYKNIKLYIDLHRDSVKHDISTITIGDDAYAKTLFVVGLSHDNYKKNLEIAKKLNTLLSSKKNITRGILQKSAANANGIYNQDLSENVILIEVGGYQNDFIEVSNTLKVLATVIKEYLDE